MYALDREAAWSSRFVMFGELFGRGRYSVPKFQIVHTT